MKTSSVAKNVVKAHQDQSKPKPKVVFKLALLQLFGTVVFSLALYYCFDKREALSALFGGLVAVLANLFFATRLFASKRDLQAGEVLVRFYLSEALKVAFTLMMMSIFIIVIKVSMLPFIIAYLIAAVIVNWLFLLSNSSH